MRVEIYAGLGTLRERRWKGDMEQIPREGEDIVLPSHISYVVERVCYRLDLKPKVVEIYIR